MMTDDDRAEPSLVRRRAAPTAPRGYQTGYMASDSRPVHVDDEVTEPERVLGRGASEVDLEILRRLNISADQVVTFADLAPFMSQAFRTRVEHKSDNKELGEQIKALHDLLRTPPHQAVLDLQADYQTLKEDVENLREDNERYKATAKWTKGLAAAVVVAALGGVCTIAVKIWSRAEAEGEAAIRLTHVERDLVPLQQLLYSRLQKDSP